MRRIVAATMPMAMTLVRCSLGSPAATMPTTMALSPASTKSMTMTVPSAESSDMEMKSSIRHPLRKPRRPGHRGLCTGWRPPGATINTPRR